MKSCRVIYMNKTNNKRNQKSEDAIRKAYLNLVISRDEISSITVSDVCKRAGINRTTFYAHYIDMDDLIDSIYEWMMREFLNIFTDEIESEHHSFDFLKLFRNIKENQIFYRLYFKLGFDFKQIFLKNGESFDIAGSYFKDTSHVDYHVEFFSAGITAIIKKWLNSGCQEEPEVIGKILQEEYQKKNSI